MWQAVESDWRTAPVSPHIRTTLGFLEKLTLRPDELTPADADAVRAAGVSDAAMVDAIHVAALARDGLVTLDEGIVALPT